MFLCQDLMGEIQVILVDKAPVEAFLLLVEVTVTIVRENLVLKVRFHNTNGSNGCVDIRFVAIPSYKPGEVDLSIMK